MILSRLPPPPSMLVYDEEAEAEEDAPPDFTSHNVPLLSPAHSLSTSSASSRHHRQKRPLASPISRMDSRWTGLHLGGRGNGFLGGGGTPSQGRNIGLNAKERALWRWINVEDVDDFLQEVYLYYVGKGIWAIGLGSLLNLL